MGRKLFQSSFYERIIRNEDGYLEACKYIDENPAKPDYLLHKNN